MKKKRPFTLLEIMIVIFLIGLIGSVIGYNMKGSMDEGRAFKTKQSISRIKDVLELELAKGTPLNNKDQIRKALTAAGIVKNVDKILKDGWGEKFKIEVVGGDIKVSSKKYTTYKQNKKALRNS